jgi:hypothetical protein
MSTKTKTRAKAAVLKRKPPVPKAPETLRAAVNTPTRGNASPLEIVEKCDLECKDCNVEKWCR